MASRERAGVASARRKGSSPARSRAALLAEVESLRRSTAELKERLAGLEQGQLSTAHVREVFDRVAGKTGVEFCRVMVVELARWLGADYVVVGRLMRDAPERVETQIVYGKGEFRPGFTYALADTPCENVVGKALQCYPSGVAARFPKDAVLAELGIEGYVGTPLFDSQGRALGIVVALFEKPLAQPAQAEAQLAMVANRIGVELERSRTEEALRRSEAQYRVLFEANPHPMWVYDLETLRFLAVNDAAIHHYGYSRDEFRAMTIADIRPSDDLDRLYDNLAVTRTRGGFDEAGVWRHRIKEGTIIEVEITSHTMEFAGRPAELVLADDVTARRCAQQQLEKRNQELTLLNAVIAASASEASREVVLEIACQALARVFDLPQVAAALVNDAGTESVVVAEYAGEARPRALGDRIEIEGNPVYDEISATKGAVVSEDVRHDPRFASTMGLAKRRGSVAMLVLPLVVAGNVVGSLGLDATEPRRWTTEEIELASSVADQVAGFLARDKLAQTGRRLEAAMAQTTDSVMITDPEGKIVYVNHAFERVTGYPAREVIGENPRVLKSGEHDPGFYRVLWDTISSGSAWQGRMVNRRRDGTRFIEDAVITPVRGPDGAITNYLAVKRDLTREIQLEEQLLQAQKMELVGRLAGGIAHDFNNVLQALIGLTELLPALHDEPSRHAATVAEIAEEVRRAAGLTRQLLLFARQEVRQPGTVKLNGLAHHTARMLRRLVRENIDLVVEESGVDVHLVADRGQIEQVVLNLVLNASDAMPDGGRLAIRVGARPPYAVLEVVDTGCGMDEATRSRIFEPFFTTKGVGKGTGLGLAVVRTIVEAHEGLIEVESEPGVGSTFRILFPIAAAEVTAGDEAVEPADMGLPRGSERILVVEDEKGVRESLGEIITLLGYRVTAVGSVEEARGLPEEPGFDLILTDLLLTDGTGTDAAEELRQRWPRLRVVLMSGYTDVAEARRQVSLGITRFLQKPFDLDTLARELRAALSE